MSASALEIAAWVLVLVSAIMGIITRDWRWFAGVLFAAIFVLVALILRR